MKTLAALLISLMLVGCAHKQPQPQVTTSEVCEKLGYQPGTQTFTDCRKEVYLSWQAQRQMLLNQAAQPILQPRRQHPQRIIIQPVSPEASIYLQ